MYWFLSRTPSQGWFSVLLSLFLLLYDWKGNSACKNNSFSNTHSKYDTLLTHEGSVPLKEGEPFLLLFCWAEGKHKHQKSIMYHYRLCVCVFMCVSEWVIILTVFFVFFKYSNLQHSAEFQPTRSADLSPSPFAHPLHAGRVWYLVALVCTQLPQICKPLCNPLSPQSIWSMYLFCVTA